MSHKPILAYKGIHSGGYLVQPGLQAEVMHIQNVQRFDDTTAYGVTATIAFKHARKKFRLPEAHWNRPAYPLPTSTQIGMDEIAELVIIVHDDESKQPGALRSGDFYRLSEGKWKIMVTLSGDNCKTLRLVGGLTVLPNGRSPWDEPVAFRSVLSLDYALETVYETIANPIVGIIFTLVTTALSAILVGP